MSKYRVPVHLYHLKRDWISILFWLLFPLGMTVIILSMTDVWQKETKVPIGLVVEDHSKLAGQLVKEIQATELLDVNSLDLEEGLYRLEQHELDSVFVIREGYEDGVLSNRRNGLLEAYSSNRSFAYQAVLEKVTSLAQQDAARSKAAFVLKHLYEGEGRMTEWNYDNIIEESRLRQETSALLRTDFTYNTKQNVSGEEKSSLLQVWGIWSLFALIGSFFLTDWLQKENRPAMQPRWLFTARSFQHYALVKFALYLVLLIAMDMLTLVIFSTVFNSSISIRTIIALVAFRLTINLLTFLVATVHKQLIVYYVTSLSIALLLTVAGGGIIPIDGLLKRWPWITNLSPVTALLANSLSVFWISGLVLLMVIWIKRGANRYA